MNTVQPIRDMNTVLDIADYLRAHNQRDYVLFMFGIYSGLRISDMLNFRVRDVRGKDVIYIREKKTGKEKPIPVQEELKEIFAEYVMGKKDYEYLFQSRNGKNKPLSRQRVYEMLKDAASKFGVEKVGCHTMRKTFGYHLYQGTKDVVNIQGILNHSNIAVTLRYIGVNQDTQHEVARKLSFKRK